jgi:hypothetical protein
VRLVFGGLDDGAAEPAMSCIGLGTRCPDHDLGDGLQLGYRRFEEADARDGETVTIARVSNPPQRSATNDVRYRFVIDMAQR